jgi:hypothetical protein
MTTVEVDSAWAHLFECDASLGEALVLLVGLQLRPELFHLAASEELRILAHLSTVNLELEAAQVRELGTHFVELQTAPLRLQ